MSLSSELKRRLETDSEPIKKRIKLASNALSHPVIDVSIRHEVALAWICDRLVTEKEKDVLDNLYDSLETCFQIVKSDTDLPVTFRVIETLEKCLRNHPEDCVLFNRCDDFLDKLIVRNPSNEFTSKLFEFVNLLLERLTALFETQSEDKNVTVKKFMHKTLISLNQFIKNIRNKYLLIDPFLHSNLIWTILNISNSDDFNIEALNVCQSITFSNMVLPYYRKYLTALINRTPLATSIEVNGEIMRPVVLMTNVILKGLDFQSHPERLVNFTKLIVHSCKSDTSALFLLTVLMYERLGVPQSYLSGFKVVADRQVDVEFARSVFLKHLQLLNGYGVSVNFRHQFDGKSEQEPKSFGVYLQNIAAHLARDVHESSFLVLVEILKLDPYLLFSELEDVWCGLIVSKKTDGDGVLSSLHAEYVNLMNGVLETVFKMNKGIDYVLSLLSKVYQKISSMDDFQINTAEELFPKECCVLFGKLSAGLVTWQNIKLYGDLVDFSNEICDSLLEKSKDKKKIIFLNATSSLLYCFYFNNNMKEQNLMNNYDNFSDIFHGSACVLMKKLYTLVKKKTEEHDLKRSFLKLCSVYGELKLILWRYQPQYKFDDDVSTHDDIFEISLLHSYLEPKDWNKFAQIIGESDTDTVYDFNILVLQNSIAAKTHSNISKENSEAVINRCKKFILRDVNQVCKILTGDKKYAETLLNILTEEEIELFIDEMWQTTKEKDFFIEICRIELVQKRNILLTSIAKRCLKSIWSQFDTQNKELNSSDCEILEYLNTISKNNNQVEKLLTFVFPKKSKSTKLIKMNVNLMNEISFHTLDNNVKNATIFTAIFIIYLINQDEQTKQTSEFIEDICKLTLWKIYELSIKLPPFFQAIPSSIFVDHFQTQILQLSPEKPLSEFAFQLIKQITISATSKDSVGCFKELMELLTAKCESANGDKKSLDIFMCGSYHTNSIIFTTLHDLKKSGMSSETRAILSQTQKTAVEVFDSSLRKIKWKHITWDETDAKNHRFMSNLSEAFSLVLTQHCKSTERDDKVMKMLTGSTGYFIKLALHVLQLKDINAFEAKGSCAVLLVSLKNIEMLQLDKSTTFKGIWESCKTFLKNNGEKTLPEWCEVNDSIVELVTNLCGSCDTTFITSFIMKELTEIKSFTVSSVGENFDGEISPKVMQKLWFCFLNANLKSANKNETRTYIVREMTRNFFLWLKNMADMNVNYDNSLKNRLPAKCDVSNDYLFALNGCLDIIIAFVQTKKMILPTALFDIIIQIPTIVILDLGKYNTKYKSLDVSCRLIEKCTTLLAKILTVRYELLQDRWQCYFAAFRKLIEFVCLKSDADRIASDDDADKLAKVAFAIERIPQLLVRNAKQDVARLAPFLIADIVKNYQRVTVHQAVKFHFNNCINCLLQLFDNHSVKFLMRNMSDASRIMFTDMYETYNKYHKYVGA